MPLPGKVSESFRRLNPHLYGGATPNAATTPQDTGDKKRIRQRSGPELNGTETAFLQYLQASSATGQHLTQSLTLLLGNGVRYTPDFVTVEPAGLATEGVDVTAYEVKGYMRDDAAVKIKVAASQYRWITFHLVTKKRKRDGGGWSIQRVLP